MLREPLTGKQFHDEAIKSFEEIWNQLDDAERQILKILKDSGASNRAELADITGKSVRTVSRKLSQLIELGVGRINGNKYSKNHMYSLNEK